MKMLALRVGTTCVVKQRCVVKHGQHDFGVGRRSIDYHRKTLSILTILTRGRNGRDLGAGVELTLTKDLDQTENTLTRAAKQ
jgi:hypothetical protein